jgi:uncharacterized membrane protein HdeD (DUF308 family)
MSNRSLFYRNMGSKERIVRVVGGALLMVCGLFALNATPLGLAIAGVGVVSLVTGLVRYCPACALAGRRPIESR